MATEVKIFFFKGEEDIIKNNDKSEQKPIDQIKDSFSKVLDGKNLSFLLGSGCSSYKVLQEDGSSKECGIPTMLPLAQELYLSILSEEDKTWLNNELQIDVNQNRYSKSLEFFLGVLYSHEYYLENVSPLNETKEKNDEPNDTTKETNKASEKEKEKVKTKEIIAKIQDFVISKSLNAENKQQGKDKEVVELYKTFFRKLLYRNTNLPKPNIFTTNYDLYSEIALDKLGIHYVNGFSGGIRKYFNPTIFNYALAEKMDLSQTKWAVIDNFFYLYKIHGSINWIQDEEELKLFKVREIQEVNFETLKSKGTIMIYPTPLKQNVSLGSPYSDLFREFQKKLMQNNNVLVSIGYSFSDEHINNLIYQAFTIPSFRLIVLGSPESNAEIEKLKSLDDPRIWIIGGELANGEHLHYFKGFVKEILPDLSNEQIDDKIEQAIKILLRSNGER
jgi:hypothetical protein